MRRGGAKIGCARCMHLKMTTGGGATEMRALTTEMTGTGICMKGEGNFVGAQMWRGLSEPAPMICPRCRSCALWVLAEEAKRSC